MRIVKLFAFSFAFLAAVLFVRAQSSFQNLDFESANPVAAEGVQAVTPGSALPGWSGAIGGAPVTQVILNDYALGAPELDLFGPSWTNLRPGIIDGEYTAMLQAGFGVGPDGDNNVPTDMSLYQNGTIPANALSLQFKAWSMLPNATLAVGFAGNSLSPVVLSSGQSPSGQGYKVFGADISAYAGETGELEFTDVFDNHGLNGIELDDITFSTVAVTPEPNTLALVVMGGLALAARRWRSGKTSIPGKVQ